MNLIIDIGNSVAKVGLFDGKTFVSHQRINTCQLATEAERILSASHCSRCIISTVAATPHDLGNVLTRRGVEWQMLSSTTPLPFVIDYLTPQTLGPDRIAAVAGAMEIWPASNVLIIDAGSCITYEVLTASAHYRGGNIAPGISLRFKAMHEHTARLPLIDTHGDTPTIGHDTATAMRAGVLRGLQYEIEGYIRTLRSELDNLRVVLTGGDAALLQSLIPEKTEADPLLVLKGLNYILNHDETDI